MARPDVTAHVALILGSGAQFAVHEYEHGGEDGAFTVIDIAPGMSSVYSIYADHPDAVNRLIDALTQAGKWLTDHRSQIAEPAV